MKKVITHSLYPENGSSIQNETAALLDELLYEDHVVHNNAESTHCSCTKSAVRRGPRKSRRIRLSIVLDLIEQLLAAGTYLEQRFISHRDIKPDNILLRVIRHTEESHTHCLVTNHVLCSKIKVSVVAQVTDFGASYAFFPTNNHSMQLNTATAEQAFVGYGGASMYLPPEIVGAAVKRSNVSLDYAKCDVYSIGCVALQMMHAPTTICITPNFVQQLVHSNAKPTTVCGCDEVFREKVIQFIATRFLTPISAERYTCRQALAQFCTMKAMQTQTKKSTH